MNPNTALDVNTGDELAKESDVLVGSDAVPPETEYFGFALYVGSTFVALVYLIWALFPKSWLEFFNIYYYPSRWWAVAFPSYIVITLVYIYVALGSYNTEVLTKPLNSLETLTDVHAKMIGKAEINHGLTHGSDAVCDLPMGEVCQVLYGGKERP